MVIWGCSQSQPTQTLISVTIRDDQKDFAVTIPSGSTVRDALQSAHLSLAETDKVEPGLGVVLSSGSQIVITRVTEEYYTEQVVIPFAHQELKNEALPEDEHRLSQPGENGLEQLTYHRLFEDGVEVSVDVVSTTIVKEAVPEIEMIGSRSMFTAIPIPGKLAYLSAGNAWIIENNTGDRSLIVSTGDLDGRVFSLSRDGRYLLFTRFSNSVDTINTLWVAALEHDPAKIIDLGVTNIVHFAGFDPSSERIAYSTAEWREAVPGWRANNDLFELDFSSNGRISAPRQDMAPDTGGVYGWWGTDFAWSPDGKRFLYSRPDSVGIIDGQPNVRSTLLEITPYQTAGDWAWVPGSAWSPAGDIIYTVGQQDNRTGALSASQQFDLLAIPLQGGTPVTLVENVGMFAYPVPSPLFQPEGLTDLNSSEQVGQKKFSVAYLQATDPRHSDTSRYNLFIMDWNGSNQKALFPQEPGSGINPQHIAWSPASLGEDGNHGIALVYNGNIWIIDAKIGTALQVTGDGLTTQVDWR